MSNKFEFISNLLILFLDKFFIKTQSIILIVLLTKILGESEFGVYTILFATIGLLIPIANLGMGEGIARFISNHSNQKKISEIYSSGLFFLFITIITSSLLFLLIFPSINSILFNNTIASNLFVPTSLLLLIWSLESFNFQYLRGIKKIKMYSSLEMIRAIVEIIGIVIIISLGLGLKSVILYYCLVKSITTIIIFFYYLKYNKLAVPKITQIKKILFYSVNLIPSRVADWLIRLSDRYVIGTLLTLSSVGIYSAAYGVGFFPIQFLAAPFFILIVPMLAKLWEERRYSEVSEFFNNFIKYFLIFSGIISTILILFSKEILELLTTSTIASQGQAIMKITVIGSILYGLYTIISQIQLLKYNTGKYSLLWIISAIFNLIFTIIFIKFIGVLGAAIATLFSYAILFIFSLTDSMNIVNFKEQIKNLLIILISLVPLIAIILVLKHYSSNLLFIGLLTIISTIIPLSICYLCKIISKNDITFLISGIKEKL